MKSKRGDKVEEIKRTTKKRAKEASAPALPPKPTSFLHTGASMLNLVCSDTVGGGFVPGSIVNIIGDSHAGKTMLALTTLAEIAQDDSFSDYRIIYDEPEVALQFDMELLFGTKLTTRMEHKHSDTVIEFHGKVSDAVKKGSPFIYVLDSLDSLTTPEEEQLAEANIEAHRKGVKGKGSYGMGKAKGMSELLRMLVRKIENTNSLLIIVSQTRQDISISFATRKRSGGDALTFYCMHVIWLAVVDRIRKDKIVTGATVRAKLSKNKVTGKQRECEFDIYPSYGIDDVGSMITYLEDNKAFGKEGNSLIVTGLGSADGKRTRAKLISEIEGNPTSLKRLKRLCQKTWSDIEEKLKLNREPRFK